MCLLSLKAGKLPLEVLGEVWYDLVNEELWDFVENKKWPVFDFSRAQKLATEKTRDLALSYFNGLGMEEN